jgi:hypothetical protein
MTITATSPPAIIWKEPVEQAGPDSKAMSNSFHQESINALLSHAGVHERILLIRTFVENEFEYTSPQPASSFTVKARIGKISTGSPLKYSPRDDSED